MELVMSVQYCPKKILESFIDTIISSPTMLCSTRIGLVGFSDRNLKKKKCFCIKKNKNGYMIFSISAVSAACGKTSRAVCWLSLILFENKPAQDVPRDGRMTRGKDVTIMKRDVYPPHYRDFTCLNRVEGAKERRGKDAGSKINSWRKDYYCKQ